MPKLLRNLHVPTPKGNKDPTLSGNYQPIALASTLSKVLEWCIHSPPPQQCCTSGLQFCFKQKMLTTLCTDTVKNIISRYVNDDSSVFACFFDASKAIGLVDYDIFFQRLLDRVLPGYLILFLLSWCENQLMSVKWGESLPAPFTVSNGVHHGGVLSPILLTIIIH